MGMFDELRCDYPLPIEGANALLFQTKDTEEQFMDQYWIDRSGALMHEAYDIEDQSDKNAVGYKRMLGIMTRVNKHWEPVAFTGTLNFYTTIGDYHSGWIEFDAVLTNGVLQSVALAEHRQPTKESEEKRKMFVQNAFASLVTPS